MQIIIILISLFSTLYAGAVYDFWDNSNNTNEKNRVKLQDRTPKNLRYLQRNDTKATKLAKDLNQSNTKLSSDYIEPLKKEFKEPKLTKDFDEKKISISPDFIDPFEDEKKTKEKKAIKEKKQIKKQKSVEKNSDIEQFKKSNTVKYTEDFVEYYDDNDREKGFIDIIPYLSVGNSLFVISQGEYTARILDDSIGGSIAIDAGLNYIWDHLDIGYLWSINLGDYDFSGKDRTNPNTPSGGNIKGYILSTMPVLFYELNRAEKMSVLIGYGVGGSYLKLEGDAVLANSSNQTISDSIHIRRFYFSRGLLLEVIHNDLMIAFTKVTIDVNDGGQNIQINENRLNLGYKFSF